MFGLKGFYISASGAIQAHHGPFVIPINWLFVEKPCPGTRLTLTIFFSRTIQFCT